QRAARTGRRKVNQCCRMSSVVIFGVLRPPEGCPAEPAGTASLVIPNGLGPLDAIEPNIMNATFAGIRASIMSPSVSGVKVTPIPERVFDADETCAPFANDSTSLSASLEERYACSSAWRDEPTADRNAADAASEAPVAWTSS